MQPDPLTSTEFKVVALVSVGAHPTSGRPRRAEQDARAVELGLRIAGEALQVVHAGDPQQEALRGYLGMGIRQLQVLEQPPQTDVVHALSEYLQDADAQLILTGSQAETGEGSGMLPYLLAEQLGWPIVVGLAEVERIDQDIAHVLQALPRGQRRRLQVQMPFIASVDNAAPLARQSAFGPARRGELHATAANVCPDPLFSDGQLQPARPRPKRLKVIKAKTGAERMKAATAKASGGGGQVLKDCSPTEAAEAIFKLLIDEGVLR
ncbi:electron transfer flavoprotein subunit beta [Pseudomonas sp. EL_65y_Pfl2_R95]|uniref:electron transfer flavoprotein subunit beta n=1 Tax=Pseudomonas sp. EL_65y_Pfl2_R95 TaxID=3088698 RepID=UPI0030DB414E